jgi:hypothetical protein
VVGTIRDVLAVLGAIGVPGGALTWWIRDRRKDKAAAVVAERTVDAEVAVKDVGGWQAQLAYVSAAFERERESLTRQIDDRDREIELLRSEGAHKDEVMALMRIQIAPHSCVRAHLVPTRGDWVPAAVARPEVTGVAYLQTDREGLALAPGLNTPSPADQWSRSGHVRR